MTPTGQPSAEPVSLPDYPLPVARIARALGVHRRTLQRALVNDPTAPAPADRNDHGHPLYLHQPVTAWWPTRRQSGRPRTPPPQPAD
ncbi:hypothetical protein [Streptomyces bacillaris]|uniref:hypothetical protein n=1 Tax=Streptomyces bacillaris TaxID=68179 RepID=UPI0034607A1C